MSATKRKRTGRRFTKQEAHLIVSLVEFFKEEKENGTRISLDRTLDRAARATGFSKATIKRMRHDPDSFPEAGEPESRTRNSVCASDADAVTAIHHVMLEMKEARKSPSVRSLYAKLQAGHGFPYSMSTMYRALPRLGYDLCPRNSYGEYIKEQDFAKRQRVEYLTRLRQYRAEGREIFFQDESWVNTHTRTKMRWWNDAIFGDDTEKIVSGKGQRSILSGVGSAKSGWLGGWDSFFCTHKVSRVHDDCHKDMNGAVFNEWLSADVIPLMPDGSVLVVDRASYHLVRTPETRPPTANNKADFLKWLRDHSVQLVDSAGRDWTTESDEAILKRAKANGTGGMNRAELERLTQENLPTPIYEAQVLVEGAKRDLKYLILPTHHPELNPIELMWRRMKDFVERNNSNSNSNDVEALVREEFNRITAEDWADCERKSMKYEVMYWEMDQQDEDSEEEE